MRKRRYRRKFRGRKLNKRQKKEVKTIISKRQELKYFVPAQVNGAASSNTPGVASLSDVPQGDSDTSRDGDRLQWAGKMDIKLSFVGTIGTAGDLYNTYRFIIFQWHPNTTPVPLDILLTGPTTNVDVYSQYNHDNRQQYKILLDKTLTTVGFLTGTSYPQSNYIVNRRYIVSLRRASKYAQFVAATTAATNKIYYFLVSDSSLIAHPTYSLSTKIFFRDS